MWSTKKIQYHYKLISLGILAGLYISLSTGWYKFVETRNMDIECCFTDIINEAREILQGRFGNLFQQHDIPDSTLLIPMNQNDCDNADIVNAIHRLSGLQESQSDHMAVKEYDSTKPFLEYDNICLLMVDIWTYYRNREVQGFITKNGKMIITAVGNTMYVAGPKPIWFNGQYFLPWPKHRKRKMAYHNVINNVGSSFIYIPVKAMFHSHVINGDLSVEDLEVATDFSDLRHLIFERKKILEFDSKGIRHIYRGNFGGMCELFYN